MTDPQSTCPDDGRCWHLCGDGPCWRVLNCGSLSAYGEDWTDLYESVPTKVEARQWTGRRDDMASFFVGARRLVWHDDAHGSASLLAGKHGAQGWVPVPVGHWIVRNPGDHTDYWPVDPAYFASKYRRSTAQVVLAHVPAQNPRKADRD